MQLQKRKGGITMALVEYKLKDKDNLTEEDIKAVEAGRKKTVIFDDDLAFSLVVVTVPPFVVLYFRTVNPKKLNVPFNVLERHFANFMDVRHLSCEHLAFSSSETVKPIE